MGRSPCCDKQGLKKGPWTPEEDQKLLAYIDEHGHGNWRALPLKAGLQRCGKSCRLRWTNYLRPDIKRGKFSLQEEQTIIQLHALLGNRWSAIATHLPKRTDNEIKNYWNTHLKKRLANMGIDPVTHKPKNDALSSTADAAAGEGGQQYYSKNAANLSHMAQWESARLEAEARLVRQSKLRSNSSSSSFAPSSSSSNTSSVLHHQQLHMTTTTWHITHVHQGSGIGLCIDHGSGSGPHGVGVGVGVGVRVGIGVESPTSTLSFSENAPPLGAGAGAGAGVIEFMGLNGNNNNVHEEGQALVVKEEGEQQEWKTAFAHDHDNHHQHHNHIHGGHYHHGGLQNYDDHDHDHDHDDNDNQEQHDDDHHHQSSFVEGFTELLLSSNNANTTPTTTTTTTTTTTNTSGGKSLSVAEEGTSCSGSDYYEDNKNYWNTILNLVNSSPSHSPMF